MSKDGSVGFADLLTQMKITNRLLAAPLKTTMGQKDLVKLLASTGATNQEIADVLDTTAATVANTRLRLKKEGSKEGPIKPEPEQ
jgi:DNA-binding CsgD family transcriptional regulator